MDSYKKVKVLGTSNGFRPWKEFYNTATEAVERYTRMGFHIGPETDDYIDMFWTSSVPGVPDQRLRIFKAGG